MSYKLLIEHHLEFLSIKGGCTGSSGSTLVKMPHFENHLLRLNYYELCQLHMYIYIISAGSKTVDFRWHKTFQDGFTNHKDGSRPGQPKTIVTNVCFAAVASLIKRDARLTLQNIARSYAFIGNLC